MARTLSFRKVVLVPGYGCNNRCVFCINSAKRGLPPRPLPQVKTEMAAAAARGCDYLEFAGGENTINPDFCSLVRFARQLGFKRVAVATNGRLFSYPEFAAAALDAGLTDIIFSIHGHTAALHDSLTRVKGGFRQMLRGLENVTRSFKGTLGTNTAVTKLNYKALPKIGRFIEGLGFCNSEFIYADPSYGGVHEDFKRLMPRISDCAPYMRECLDIAAPRIRAARNPQSACNWAVRYVPLCHFTDYLPLQISEMRETVVYRNVQHVAPDYVNLDAIRGRREMGRGKPPKCAACALAGACEGIWRAYLAVYGDEELHPFSLADLPASARKALPKK